MRSTNRNLGNFFSLKQLHTAHNGKEQQKGSYIASMQAANTLLNCKSLNLYMILVNLGHEIFYVGLLKYVRRYAS